MSAERVVYSIQRAYILTALLKQKKEMIICNQRIDIPTIEPLSNVKLISPDGSFLTVIPCIELVGEFLSEVNLTFETNEGVTVLPVEIQPGSKNPEENPYTHFRYVLVLPRGTTGVKSCKLIHKATGKEVQHNFTFGVMPPPYNYDNALSGYWTGSMLDIYSKLIDQRFMNLCLTTETPTFPTIDLPKGAGKQTIRIKDGVLFYETVFSYPSSEEPTIHKPKITLHGNGFNDVYTLSLNKDMNGVSIDLFTGMIRVFDVNGEITQQRMLKNTYEGYETLSFENFDDINRPSLIIYARGARVSE